MPRPATCVGVPYGMALHASPASSTSARHSISPTIASMYRSSGSSGSLMRPQRSVMGFSSRRTRRLGGKRGPSPLQSPRSSSSRARLAQPASDSVSSQREAAEAQPLRLVGDRRGGPLELQVPQADRQRRPDGAAGVEAER